MNTQQNLIESTKNSVWYVEADIPGVKWPLQGSAVLVEMVHTETGDVGNFLLTCLHVVCGIKQVDSSFSFTKPSEIRCWRPGASYSEFDDSNSYRAELVSLRPIPETPTEHFDAYDDWVLLKIDHPKFREVSCTTVWSSGEQSISTDGLSVVGYPDGRHGFEPDDLGFRVKCTVIKSLTRSHRPDDFTFTIDTLSTKPGMSGGACFSEDGTLIGLHREGRDKSIKRTEVRVDRIADELLKGKLRPYFPEKHEQVKTETAGGKEPTQQQPVAQRTLRPNESPASRFELKELDWYDEADAEYFQGRDDDVTTVLGLLMKHSVLRLFGPSGVGKSSLLRAGLIPELKANGFRVAVVRPMGAPSVEIPRQLSQQLLDDDSRPLSSTLSLDQIVEELGPAMQKDGCRRLFLLIDQVEDVVSPLVPADARLQILSFLRQVWKSQSQEITIKALVAYRTDSDSRLGPLWQEVSGEATGLPYHTVLGLSREAAEKILRETTSQAGISTDLLPEHLLDDLIRESLPMEASGDIFPPYLQMILARLATVPKSADSEEHSPTRLRLGTVTDLIGDFMRYRLDALQSRGGDFEKAGQILQSLSRSSGQKLTLTLGEIAAEIRLHPDSLSTVLDALHDSRLIRTVGPESYELQHDRLAQVVMESLSDQDREFKAARELLSAKAMNHKRTGQWLVAQECEVLYRHKSRLTLTRSEQYLILGSILACELHTPSPVVGWGLLFNQSLIPALRGIVEDGGDYAVFSRAIDALRTFGFAEDLPLFRRIATEGYVAQQEIAVKAIADFRHTSDLILLRQLASDGDEPVRLAAIAAIPCYQQAQDLFLFRDLLSDESWEVRSEAVKAITNFDGAEAADVLRRLTVESSVYQHDAVRALGAKGHSEDRQLLRKLATCESEDVRHEAVGALGRFKCPEDLSILIYVAQNEFEDIQTLALERLIEYPTALLLPVCRTLAESEDHQIREFVAKVLGRNRDPVDLPFLRRLAKDRWFKVFSPAIRAIAETGQPEDLLFIAEFVNHETSTFRKEAVLAIGMFPQNMAMPHLCKFARKDCIAVRDATIAAVARFSQTQEVRQLLSELIDDEEEHLRIAACDALANFQNKDDLPLFRELARTKELQVRGAAVSAIAGFQQADDLELLSSLAHEETGLNQYFYPSIQAIGKYPRELVVPLLLDLAKEPSEQVRRECVEAIASFATSDDLELLVEFAKDEFFGVRKVATQAICDCCVKESVADWFEREVCILPDDVLVLLDRFLYAPEWFDCSGN